MGLAMGQAQPLPMMKKSVMQRETECQLPLA